MRVSAETPDAGGDTISYGQPIPPLISPVKMSYNGFDRALRRLELRKLRKDLLRNDSLPQRHVAGTIDSIRITDNLAIHPADTLNLIPERHYSIMKSGMYLPLIYDSYQFLPLPTVAAPDPLEIYTADTEDIYERAVNSLPKSGYQTIIDDLGLSMLLSARARQQLMIDNPLKVEYVLSEMAVAPEGFKSAVAPGATQMTLEEIVLVPASNNYLVGVETRPIHWLRTFQASLQFSQAYISPNWYQGGSNNLNAILNIYYNIKLNEKFHPNLLFDTTVQYKLGLNSAPDDTLHSYNVTEDLFQVYSKFGLKASNNWYYTLNTTFKTQLTNSYVTNQNVKKSAFMSPGELNIGLGMTYSKTTPRLQFNASIAPLSYNLKTCLSDELDPENFGIDAGKKAKSEFGSSSELTFKWKWSYNINYSSRLFLFTDYEYAQGDWENTISFDVNRFLSTQFYFHLRFDTQSPRLPDTDWHRFQFKEIFSFGFAYKFSTI
ncbi:MAG: DUF3078 domain-containing protein [Bacteroides sp.]|nr:DUF3078 domain-containing protein [Bacteroides sp.]MDE7470054.1 DUF3078 domain-containing protein [Paramuribaculum sp.]